MTMTPAHVYEIFIRASRERVWNALIDPEYTTQYFHGTRFESSFEPGAPYVSRIVEQDRLAVDGTIEVFETSAEDGSQMHVVRIPVVLVPGV